MLAGRARDLLLDAAGVFAELERVEGVGVGALSSREKEAAVDEDSFDVSGLTTCVCNLDSVVGCGVL